ncbi:D-tyrosyl-tRNA(Tyr) deacylase [bacterium]|nr:D-tyrosyl-tRNA(Tyr) deacylase [bacterium]
MKAVVQRVSQASVSVNQSITASIDKGLCVFLGIHYNDTATHSSWMIDKLLNLRVFPDQSGTMTYSIRDKGYGILIISQFTLYGNCQKGRRPSFTEAAPTTIAEPIYNTFISMLSETYSPSAAGIFGANMAINLVNDGPVTLLLER